MRRSLVLFLLAFLTTVGNAQLVLPFEFYDNKFILVTLPEIRSNDSLVFCFDTGASATLLDKKAAERLNLKPDMQQAVEGAGGERIYEIVTDQTVHITGKDSVTGVNLILEDLTRLNSSIGKRFDGVIGNDIIQHYQTVIDFDRKVILLYSFNQTIETAGYTELPFMFKGGIPIPQFPVTISLFNGDEFTGDVFFDSGAGILLMINSPFVAQHEISRKVGKKVVSIRNDLHGKSQTTLSLIRSLKLGTHLFDGRMLVQLSGDAAGVGSYKGYLGILGIDIISRFNVILNYESRKLYLKPNALYNKTFVSTVPPIKLAFESGKIVVASVIAGSDAYKKGMREGQVIVSINGLLHGKIETYRKMLLEEGSTVTVRYIDQGNERECRIVIEKLL